MAERRNCRNVTVLYGENKLQNMISLPASATVRKAKEAGSKEMIKHLRLQSGVPPDITIDDECTDVYPSKVQSQHINVQYIMKLACSFSVAPDNTLLRDLEGQATIILWPKSMTATSTLTPSPIMNALGSKTSELSEARSKLSLLELLDDQEPKSQKSKPGEW